MKNYFLVFIMVFSLELNAQGDQTSTTPPAESGDSLSCFGICDEFTKWARQYIDKLTAGAQKEINKYVSMADINIGSEKFGIKGNADLGQLKMPSYNCAKGDGGKLGTGDFGLKPSYKIRGLIFGQSVDIVDVRLSGKQEGYAATAQNKDDKGLKLSVKIMGIDVLNKKNKGPTGELKKAPTTAPTTPTTPAPKKDSSFLPPKPDKKGTGGKLLDIARKITDNGPMPRVDIIPPVLYVGIDAGFHLSAELMFTYGVTSPFFNYRATTQFVAKPLDSDTGYCEAPVGGNNCTMKAVTTSSRSSIVDDIKNSVDTVKNNVNATVSSFENLKNKAKDVKVNKAFKDAKAAYQHSQDEDNEGGFCSNLTSVLRPVQELGDQVQGSIDAAKEAQANVNQLVSSVGALYKQSEQAANLIGAVVDGKFENIPELTADVAVRLNGRASAWVQALLILDAVVAQAYGGVEGRVVLVDASMGIGAKLSTKSKYLDFSSQFTLLRLQANLDAVYGLKSKYFSLPPGRKQLLHFPGYLTHKEAIFARLDFRPNPGQNPFVWCGGMFGSPDDPARCDDTPEGFSEVALGLALHDKVTKEYLGEPSLDLNAGCLISDLSGNIIATHGNADGNCEIGLLTASNEFVKTKLADTYKTRPALFLSYARGNDNQFKFGLRGEDKDPSTTTTMTYSSQVIPEPTFDEENKTVVVSDFYPKDPYSEQPSDWIYSITKMGISFINLEGEVEEADRTRDEFQIFVSKDGDQLDTSTKGVYKLFVGDIIGLPNQQIVDLAKNYRLGACVLKDMRLRVKNVGYPRLSSDVLDALNTPDQRKFSDEQRKLAMAGDLNVIKTMGAAGCNEVDDGIAYAACHLRKAISEEQCFPQDKVKELVYMANLSDSEAYAMFEKGEISGSVDEDTVLHGGFTLGNNAGTYAVTPFPECDNIKPLEPCNGCSLVRDYKTCIGKTHTYWEGNVSRSFGYRVYSHRRFVQKFKIVSPNGMAKFGERLTALEGLESHYGPSPHCEDGVPNCEYYRNEEPISGKFSSEAYENDDDYYEPLKIQIAKAKPFTTTRHILQTGTRDTGGSIPEYHENTPAKIGIAVKECIIGNDLGSCSINLGSDLSLATANNEEPSYCKIRYKNSQNENVFLGSEQILGKSPSACISESALADLSLFCNTHRDQLFGTNGSESGLERVISLIFYSPNKSANTLTSRSSPMQTSVDVGTCRRNTTNANATIVGTKTTSDVSAGIVSIPDLTSSNSTPSSMSLEEYNPFIENSLPQTNCALLIGPQQTVGTPPRKQKKNFSEAYATFTKNNQCVMVGSGGGPSIPGRGVSDPIYVADPNTAGVFECHDRNNDMVMGFINTCFGQATGSATELDEFCQSLPPSFLESLDLTQTTQLELQVVHKSLSDEVVGLDDLTFSSNGTSSILGNPWVKTCTLSPQKIANMTAGKCGIRLTQIQAVGANVDLKVSLPLFPLDPPLQGLHNCGASIERNILTSNFDSATSVWSRPGLSPDDRQRTWETSLCDGINRFPQAMLLSPGESFRVTYEGIPNSVAFNCSRPTLADTLASQDTILNSNSDCKLVSWLVTDDLGRGQHQEFFALSSSDSNCTPEINSAMSSPVKAIICEANKKTYSNSLGHVESDVANRQRFPLNPYSSTPTSFGTNLAFNYRGGEAQDITSECAFLLIPAKYDDYIKWKKGPNQPIDGWGSELHPVRMVTTDEFRSYDNDFGSSGFEDKDSMACVKQSHSVGPTSDSRFALAARMTDGRDNIDDGRNCMELKPNQKILFAGPGVTAIHRLPLSSDITDLDCTKILSQTDLVDGKTINRTEADLNGKVKVWIRSTDTNSNIINGVPGVRDDPDFECTVPSCNVRLDLLLTNGSQTLLKDNYLDQEMAILSTKPTNHNSCRGLLQTYTSTSCSVSLTTGQTCPPDKIVPSMICGKIAQDPSLPSGTVGVFAKFGDFSTTNTHPLSYLSTCTVPAKSCQVALVNDFIPGRPLPLGVIPTNLQTVPNATSIANCETLIKNIESSRNDDRPEPSLCSSELAANASVDRTRPYSLIASYGGNLREIRKCPLAPKISETPFVENGILKLKHTVTVGDTEFEGMLAFVYLERSTLPASDCTSPSLSYVPVYSSNLDERTEGGFIVPTTNQVGTATALPGQTYCLRAWSGRAQQDIKSDVPRNEYYNSPVVVTRMEVPGRCEIEVDVGQNLPNVGQNLPRVWIGAGALAEFGAFKGNYRNIEGAHNYYSSLDTCISKLSALNQEQYEQGELDPVCSSFVNETGELPTNRNSLMLRVRMGNSTVNLPAQINPLCEPTRLYPMIPNWGSDSGNRCAIVRSDSEEQYSTLNYSRLLGPDAWPRQTTRQVIGFTRGTTGAITPTYASSSQSLLLSDTFDECQRQTRKFGARICYLDYGPDLVPATSARINGEFSNKRSWILEDSCQYPSIRPLLSNGVAGLESWIDSSHVSSVFKDENCTIRSSLGEKVSCLKDRLTGEAFKIPRGATKFPTYGRLTDDNVRPERHHLLVDAKTGNGLSGRMRAKAVGSIFVVYRNSPAAAYSTPFTTAAFAMDGVNGMGKLNGAHGLLHGDNQHGPGPVLRSSFRDNGFDFAQKWLFPKPANYRIYNFNLSESIRVGEVDYFLGSDRGSSGRLINGGVAEVLMYANPLGRAQIEQIEGYLACKWGLQNDLYPGHPYRLSSCDPKIDSSGPIKTDEVIIEDTPSVKDPVFPSIVVEKGKEFCGSVIDATKQQFKTFTIGFCKEEKCSTSNVSFKKSYVVNPGEKLNWVTNEFTEEFGADLIAAARDRKKDFISAVIYLDEKPIATSLYFNSSDAQVSEECGYGN